MSSSSWTLLLLTVELPPGPEIRNNHRGSRRGKAQRGRCGEQEGQRLKGSKVRAPGGELRLESGVGEHIALSLVSRNRDQQLRMPWSLLGLSLRSEGGRILEPCSCHSPLQSQRVLKFTAVFPSRVEHTQEALKAQRQAVCLYVS